MRPPEKIYCWAYPFDQPFLAEKGWVSVDPAFTRENAKYADVLQCNVGDFALFYNVTSTDFVEVTIVQGILEPIQTYVIGVGEDDMLLVANGLLVGLN